MTVHLVFAALSLFSAASLKPSTESGSTSDNSNEPRIAPATVVRQVYSQEDSKTVFTRKEELELAEFLDAITEPNANSIVLAEEVFKIAEKYGRKAMRLKNSEGALLLKIAVQWYGRTIKCGRQLYKVLATNRLNEFTTSSHCGVATSNTDNNKN